MGGSVVNLRQVFQSHSGANPGLAIAFALRWLALSLIVFSRLAFADVWVADDKSLYKLDLTANQTTLTVSSSGTLALAVDAKDGSVWTLTDKTLAKRSSAGAVVFQLDLKTLGLSGALNFSLDVRDGSLWIGEGEGLPNGNTRLFAHIAGNGSIIGAYPSPGGISGIAVALDQSVWVLGNKRLLHYTPQGAVQSPTSSPSINGDPKLFLVDSIGAWVWVSAQKRLIRIDAHAQPAAPLSISVAEDATALASDEQRGVIWVLAGKLLIAYDSAGTLKTSIDTEALGIKSANSLAFDPVTRSLLVGNDKGVTRLSQDGASPILIPTAKQINLVGVSSFTLDTRLSLVAPTDGTLSNNATLPLALQLRALCSGSDCGFGNGFYHGYILSVKVNGQEIGSAFTIDPNTGKATYQPTTRYAEGLNTVVARATDSFGQVSNTVNFSFTIDTIPPSFMDLAPADGMLTTKAPQTIKGRISEPGSLTINNQNVPLNPDLSFSYSTALLEGKNSFDLLATDRAGNVGHSSLNYVLDTLPPAAPVVAQILLGSVSGGVTLVNGLAGSVEPNARVVITNLRTGLSVTVLADATGAFTAWIAAQGGDTITFVAADAAGNKSPAVNKPTPAPDPNALVEANGYVSGMVYDASSGSPLANVTVHARGVPGSGVTGADGKFILPVPGHSTWALFFARPGYIDARRDSYVRPGGDATVGQVAMRAADTATFNISAATGGSFTDPTGNVQVIIPPWALPQDASFSATWFSTGDSFPLPLPDNFIYLGGVQMGPEHIIFNKPVTLRVRNNLRLPPGTMTSYFYVSHDENDPNEGYYDPGFGVVTADGAFIEYQMNHFSCAPFGIPPPGGPLPPGPPGPPSPPGPPPPPGPPGPPGPPAPPEDPPPCGGEDGSSTIGYCRGNLSLEHDLPAVYSYGTNDAPALTYNSSSADPRPMISDEINMQGYGTSSLQSVGVRAQVAIEGSQTDIFIAPSSNTMPLHFLWDGTNSSGQKLPNGSYPYTLAAYNSYNTITLSGTTLAVPSYSVKSTSAGRVIVNDQTQSPFGAGWELAELAHVYRNTDGTLLMKNGNSATLFNPVATSTTALDTGTLVKGLGDTRSIAAGPDGMLYATSSGSIYRIALDGSTTVVASSAGLASAKGIAVSMDGTIYVGRGGTVYRLPPGGTPQLFVQLAGVDHLDDLVFSPDGNLFVLDGGIGRIHKVTPGGVASLFYDGVAAGYSRSLLTNAMSMAFDAAGNLYVSNNYNSLGQARCGVSFISKFDKVGNHSYFRAGLNSPRGLAIDKDGNVFAADYDCNGSKTYQVKMLTPAGETFPVALNIAGDVNIFGLSYDLALASGKLYMVRPRGDVVTIATRVATQYISLFKAPLADFSDLVQDPAGNLTQTERDGTQRKFNAQGYLLQTLTPRSKSWQYQYDSQNRLLSRTNAAGQSWNFEYTGSSGLSKITDPAGRVLNFTIDASNNLTRVEEPGGSVMTYTYDGNHRIISKTDSRGNTASYTYGAAGNVTEVAQSNGEVRKFSSGRARVAITSAAAKASSIANPIILPARDTVEDIYTNGAGVVTRRLTNGYGSAERIVDGLGTQTVTTYNQHNQPLTIAYPNGALRTFDYDTLNRLVADTLNVQNDSSGIQRFYSYDVFNRITNISGNAGVPVSVSYDSNYNPTTISLGGFFANKTYNAFGQALTSETSGKVTRYGYDAAGRLSTITDPLGQITRLSYDLAGNPISIQDAKGRVSGYDYDAAGRLMRTTDPAGNITQFDWQANCATCGRAKQLLTSVTDALGHVTRFDYDSLGLPIRETDPAGFITSYSYDANRNLAAINYPNGNAVTFTRDALDRVTKKVTVNDTVQYTYDVMGNLTSAGNGSSSLIYSYDQARRAKQVDSNGSAQAAATLAQNFSGYVRSALHATANAASRDRQFLTDSLLRPSVISDVGGDSYLFGYNGSGLRAELYYGGNRSRYYTYDDNNRLLNLSGSAFPGDTAYTYGYDIVGNTSSKTRGSMAAPALSASTDNNSVTVDALTLAGQLNGAVSVTLNGTVLTPGANGMLSGTVPLGFGTNILNITATSATGSTSASVVVDRQPPPTTQVQVSRVLAVAPNGDVYFLEAGITQATAAMIANGSGAVQRPAWLTPATDVSVDSAGIVYSLRGTQVWRHDSTGDRMVVDFGTLAVTDMRVGPDNFVYLAVDGALYRLDAQGVPVLFATLPATGLTLDSSVWGLVAYSSTSYSFYKINADGTATLLTTPGGGGRYFAVNASGTICYWLEGGAYCIAQDGTATWTNILGMSLQFDAAGALYTESSDNVIRMSGGAQTALISSGPSVTPVTGTLTITASYQTATTTQYTYDNRDELAAVTRNASPAENFAYDAVGNRTSDLYGAGFTYDARNQLLAANGVNYTYDANGNRIAKTDASGVTKFTYDGQNQLIRIDFADKRSAEYAYDPFGRRIQKKLTDALGAITIRRYVYDGAAILFETDAQGNLLIEFVPGPRIDEPLAMKRNGQTYTYHADAQGSIVAITDAASQLVQRYEYDAYGNIVSVQDPAFKQPYTYTGREWDEESGLYYYRARYYDPVVGRFLQEDPIGLVGGINRFAYVNNSPSNYDDPYGLWPSILGKQMPGRDRAEAQLPRMLQQLVPDLTKPEAQQVSDDAINELGWGDVNKVLDVTPNIMDLPPPKSLNDLSPGQLELLNKFLDKLPDRDKDAIKKIKDACPKK